MTHYTRCNDCDIAIPYIKDKDRYVTCPICRSDIFVGTKKTYRKGKFSHLKKHINMVNTNAPKLVKKLFSCI